MAHLALTGGAEAEPRRAEDAHAVFLKTRRVYVEAVRVCVCVCYGGKMRFQGFVGCSVAGLSCLAVGGYALDGGAGAGSVRECGCARG